MPHRTRYLPLALLTLSLILTPSTNLDAEDPRGAHVSTLVGQVVDEDGAPIANAEIHQVLVNIDRASARSGEDGRFTIQLELPDIRPVAVIDVTAQLKTRVRIRRETEGTGPEPIDVGQVTLKPGRGVRVSLTDPEGNPITQAWVEVDGYILQEAGAGIYAGEGFSREGRPAVEISHPRFETIETTLPPFDAEQAKNPLYLADQRFTLTPLPALRGAVADEDGEAVHNAKILAELKADETAERRPRAKDTLSTDQDGFFEFRLQPGLWSLRIQHPEFADRLIHQVDILAGTPKDLGEIVLDAGLELQGIVLDADDEPVPNAQVEAFYFRGVRAPKEASYKTSAGPEGEFTLRLWPPEHHLVLHVRHPGYVPFESGTTEWTEDALEISLERGGEVTGIVVDENDRAIARAEITPHTIHETMANSIGQPIWSGADGTFRVSGLRNGRHQLRVSAEGFADKIVEPFAILEDQSAELQIAMERPATVQGRVLGPDGRPVESGSVRLRQRIGEVSNKFPAQRIRQDGFFRLTDLSPGPAELKVFHQEHGSLALQVDLKPGAQTYDLQFELRDPPNFSGRLIPPEGYVFTDESVLLSDRNSSTNYPKFRPDSDGFFSGRVDPGTYDLVVQSSRLAHYVHPEPVVIGPGSAPPIEIPLPLGATVLIDIVGLTHSEIDQLGVNAMVPTGTDSATGQNAVRIGPSRFRVTGLGVGEYPIHAGIGMGGREEKRTVAIQTAGEEQVLEIVFNKAYTLSGRVLRNGEPATDGFVTAETAEENPVNRLANIGADGTFRIERLEPATYEISINFGTRVSLFDWTRVEVSGDTTVEWDVEAYDVGGRVVDVEGRPLAGLEVLAWRMHRTQTGLDGSFLLRALKPGVYHLNLAKEGYAPQSVTADLREGSLSDLEIVMAPSRSVDIEVHLGAGVSSQLKICQLDSRLTPLHCEEHSVGETRLPLASFSSETTYLLFVGEGLGITALPIEEVLGGPVELQPAAGLSLALPRTSGSTGPPRVRLRSPAGHDLAALQASLRRSPITWGWARTLRGFMPGTWSYEVETEDGRLLRGEFELVSGQTTRVEVE